MQKNIDSKEGGLRKKRHHYKHNWMPIRCGITMAPRKMQGLDLRIQRQQLRDLHNFRFDCMNKQMCNIVCFNPFKPFIVLKEIEKFEGR
jgi:hypothetical protein